ncbi:predicted transcriptional regulator [Phenylobacterium zucineum HLK1]|uniref:Predicted transcriptional regulator n=1 Tax=Phenylobacterium zucineum (strain HLK1) TaxID=450851 RepID=B4RA12_PHEZH|nr:helix-turn-helix domain-containing protein [Phenylobacterium zucineum]ACG79516.1 predicted transcriptional regulator [Phenylobacterium zucineum HLK1]
MKGYGQFCPVAKTAEIFAQRWTPLIVRELCFGPHRFSELHAGVPTMSRALLVQRLAELEEAGVIATEPIGQGKLYRLTPAGECLREIIVQMSAWGQRYGQGRLGPADLDPTMLVWSMKRQVDPRELPDRDVVVRLEFRGVPKAHAARRYWWIILRPDDVEVCFKAPEQDVDVVVSADLETFIRVWMGYAGFSAAQREGMAAISGDPQLVRLCRRVLGVEDEPHHRLLAFEPRAAA